MKYLLLVLLAAPLMGNAQVRTQKEIANMMVNAPLAMAICKNSGLTDCKDRVYHKIVEDLIDTGYSSEEANACATSVLNENKDKEAAICIAAFKKL